MIKKFLSFPIALAAILALAHTAPTTAQNRDGAEASMAPQLSMHLVENFFKYPATYVMGEVIGVSVV